MYNSSGKNLTHVIYLLHCVENLVFLGIGSCLLSANKYNNIFFFAFSANFGELHDRKIRIFHS